MFDFLISQMKSVASEPAVADGNRVAHYSDLLANYRSWCARLKQSGIAGGQVVSVEGEYEVRSISALMALAANKNIAVPLSRDSQSSRETFLKLAQVEWRITIDEKGESIEAVDVKADHPLYASLRECDDPGLVLFTSGSTGANKAAVHNLRLLMEKFHTPRQRLRTIVFLQLDHIGGINTLFYTLYNGGMVVVPKERSPAVVCEAIALRRVDLLPTSPTFLNLLLLSHEYLRYDVSSLRLITYGTEPMPQSTLARVHAAFPGVTLQQTYGMTELGILRSKSRDSDSLWVRVGGEGYETKVVDGRLWVRAKSAMLGYLNAASPFDAEGYLDTGDQVEVDGEWLRILGRSGEVINVGGSKVFPAQVESVLLEMEGVADVAVRGEPHPLTGQMVTATVCLTTGESPRDYRVRMRQHCQRRLPSFAVPAKVALSNERLHNERFKRVRSAQ
jgi:acyl-coenzyme A synthetase/AMP-(fatty) acid ligase